MFSLLASKYVLTRKLQANDYATASCREKIRPHLLQALPTVAGSSHAFYKKSRLFHLYLRQVYTRLFISEA